MAQGLIKTIIYKIFNHIFDEEWKGRYGEKLTSKALSQVSF